MRITGTIEEVGTERQESVSLAARNAMGNAAAGALTAVPRAIGVMLALLFAPLRMLLVPSLMGRGARRHDRDQLQIPVTPFVLKASDGTDYDCTLRGEVRGGFLKLGEGVEVVGRIDRSRVVRVDQVRSLRTGGITKGWVDPRAAAAKAQTIVGLVVAAAVVLLVVGFLGQFGGH